MRVFLKPERLGAVELSAVGRSEKPVDVLKNHVTEHIAEVPERNTQKPQKPISRV